MDSTEGVACRTRPDRADGVRYAVLQRIAPSIRHDIVAHLQPIPMIYEVLQHRIDDAGAKAELMDCVSSMTRFAKAALSSGVSAVSWLERDESLMIPAAEAIAESVAMLSRSFIFMGFRLRNEAGQPACDVNRDSMRHTLTAVLLAAVDQAEGTSDVTISSSSDIGGLALSVKVLPAASRGALQPYQEAYRSLSWADAEDVAKSEGVEFRRLAQGAMLIFPSVAQTGGRSDGY